MANARTNTAAMYRKTIRNLKLLAAASLIISVIAVLSSAYVLLNYHTLPANATKNTTTANTVTFGDTLAGIDQPLNSSALAVINNEPNTYFETGGEMLLNGSIDNEVTVLANNVSVYTAGGKPSVIYLGSITCVWCGENRWAMALALSRFGKFSMLYLGYSSIGDSDVPTLYWKDDPLNLTGVTIGNSYSSNYINFYTFEDTAPITGGFFMQLPQEIQQEVNATGNSSYEAAFNYLMTLQASNSTAFQGTPYTIWTGSEYGGADAIDFGNTLPETDVPQLTSETHGQVLRQLSNPDDQFAWTEYAAADSYISKICKALNNSASICSVPVIQRLETV